MTAGSPDEDPRRGKDSPQDERKSGAEGSSAAGGDADASAAQALREFLDRRNVGESLTPERFLAERGELPPELGDVLRAAEAFDALIKEGGRSQATLGDFRILREIGRGGMGIVYEAWQVSLDRRVALKMLPASLVARPKAVERFQREARVAARFHHQNIVEIYGSGIEAGVPYYAMELVDGETLEQIQARQRELTAGRGPERGGARARAQEAENAATPAFSAISKLLRTPDWRQAPAAGDVGASEIEMGAAGVGTASVGGGIDRSSTASSVDRAACRRVAEAFAGVAAGVHYAHAMGVIHRDLKPANLLLDKSGRLRILDFGLAWAEGQDHLTEADECVGTPLYMSPEQARPGSRPVGPTTDIYSLGAALYEVLAGRPPLRGRSRLETLHLIVHRDPTPLRKLNPRIPKDLETIVLKCLLKTPLERYATAEALAQDLWRFVRGEPIEARPRSGWEKAMRLAWLHKEKAAIAAVSLVLLASLGYTALRHFREERRRTVERYEEQVQRLAMKMQPGLLAAASSRRAPVQGDYPEWFFVPRQGAHVNPDDIDSILGEHGLKPVREAVEGLGALIALLPQRADARYHRAKGLLVLGADEEAKADLDTALARDPGFVPAAILRIALVSRAGGDQAAAEAEAALSARSGWAAALLAAHQASADGRWGEAEAAYDRLIDELPASGEEPYLGGWMEAWLGRGLVRLRQNDAAGALEDFLRAEGRWPSYPESVLLAGTAYILKGDAAQAEKRFLERLRTSPSPSEAALAVADVYGSLGLDEKALEWAGRIPDEPIRARVETAFHLKLKRWDDAMRSGRRSVELAPRDPLAHIWHGLALMAGEGDFAAAFEMFDKARGLDPASAIPHVLAGDALARQGKLPEAEAAYIAAIRLDARNPLAHVSLAVTRERQAKLVEAFGGFLEALRLDPALRTPYIHFDMLLRRRDRPSYGDLLDGLIGELDRLLAAPDGHPRRREMSKILLLALGQSPRGEQAAKGLEHAAAALEWMAAARAVDPETMAAVARVLYANGKRREAVLALEQALRLPRSKRLDRETLDGYRRALLPDMASYASIDAVLAGLDLEPLVPDGATWRYFKGRSAPSSGIEWTRLGFDDGSWDSGPSGFGYGDGDDATVLADMQNGYSTLYIRHRFEVADAARYRRLLFSARVDDGLIAYLNGVKIVRIGVGRESDGLPFDALSANLVQSEPLAPFELRLDAGLLRPGTNVLAVQGLNVQKDSSDFSLIPALRGETAPDAERDAKLLEDFRASLSAAIGEAAPALSPAPSPERRLRYLEARILQRRRLHAEAARVLDGLVAEDDAHLEPFLARAEALDAAGRPGDAERGLRELLSRAFCERQELWGAWLALAFDRLKRTPAEMPAAFPLTAGAPAAAAVEAAAPCRHAEDVRWLLERLQAGEALRINCGGDDYEDRSGRRWRRDGFFGAGARFSEAEWSAPSPGPSPAFGGDIAGTDDDLLYQTERWFPVDEIAPFHYRVPLPSGRYRVTLHFAEIHFQELGKRIFDVHVEGTECLRAHEPIAAGAKTPGLELCEVEVADGSLDIAFLPQAEFPKISAIEIEAAAGAAKDR
jgi:serine/threonine protein kinase/Tfp pilus assembly protein PilF